MTTPHVTAVSFLPHDEILRRANSTQEVMWQEPCLVTFNYPSHWQPSIHFWALIPGLGTVKRVQILPPTAGFEPTTTCAVYERYNHYSNQGPNNLHVWSLFLFKVCIFSSVPMECFLIISTVNEAIHYYWTMKQFV